MQDIKITKEVYIQIMKFYNPAIVTLKPFYVNDKAEVKQKCYKAVIERFGDVIVKRYGQNFLDNIEIQWQGANYYDLYGISRGKSMGTICTIDEIIQNQIGTKINVKELLKPELIEKRYGGRVFGIFRVLSRIFPTRHRLEYITVNTTDKDVNALEILESLNINPKDCSSNCYKMDLENSFATRVTELNYKDLLIFLLDEVFGSNWLEVLYYSDEKSVAKDKRNS